MHVRLTQIDGKLPNLALMKLAHWHKARGDTIDFSKDIARGRNELPYDRVYGSAIFSFSADRVAEFKQHWPEAIMGGTWDIGANHTVEQLIGVEEYEHYDYSIYSTFEGSIGFTQRGCRLKCGFCVVPRKEGKARTVNRIADIYRGVRTKENYQLAMQRWQQELADHDARKPQMMDLFPTEADEKRWQQRRNEIERNQPGPDHRKHLHLLDNDFFGQPEEQWQARLNEIRDGEFKVCLNQGINTRMIDPVSAAALGSIKDRLFDDGFTTHRLYTAWDNIGDEKRFFAGVDLLEQHGIRPSMLLVYMLVGYDKRETWERLLYRFHKMAERQIRPYPMIFDRERKRGLPLGDLQSLSIEIAGRTRWLIKHPNDLRLQKRTLQEFQRWAIRKYYTVISFEDYESGKTDPLPDWGQARIKPIKAL